MQVGVFYFPTDYGIDIARAGDRRSKPAFSPTCPNRPPPPALAAAG